MIMLAGAHRDLVAHTLGSLLDVEVRLDANRFAAKDVVVDARSDLRRQPQELRGSRVCCGTAHVSLVHLICRNRTYILFCDREDLLRFNNLHGLFGYVCTPMGAIV